MLNANRKLLPLGTAVLFLAAVGCSSGKAASPTQARVGDRQVLFTGQVPANAPTMDELVKNLPAQISQADASRLLITIDPAKINGFGHEYGVLSGHGGGGHGGGGHGGGFHGGGHGFGHGFNNFGNAFIGGWGGGWGWGWPWWGSLGWGSFGWPGWGGFGWPGWGGGVGTAGSLSWYPYGGYDYPYAQSGGSYYPYTYGNTGEPNATAYYPYLGSGGGGTYNPYYWGAKAPAPAAPPAAPATPKPSTPPT